MKNLLGVISLLAYLSACTTATQDDPEIPANKARININVDWNSLESDAQKITTVSQNSSSESKPITHFGARLEYIDEDAAFSQSVSKETAENEGLITMEVPTSEEANLFVVAVHYTEGSYDNPVLLYGSKRDIAVEEQEEYNWDVSNFSLVKPEWHIVDSLSTEYQSGTFTRDKMDYDFDMWYKVNTPFISKDDAEYADLIVGLNGQGGPGEYENGYRDYFIQAINPNQGSVGESIHEFYPYLRSARFGLPTSRYVVGSKNGVFEVSWE